MPTRPANIPAHAQEFYFTAPPMPLIGNEAWSRSYTHAERTAQSRPASKRAQSERTTGKHSAAQVERGHAQGERCGTKRAGMESGYELSEYDRERWLKPPQTVGDGSVVKYDAILTRAGIYEFEDDNGDPIYILKPDKILEVADWSGVPVLMGPDHPKRDDDPESPYAFDVQDVEDRSVGAVLQSYFLSKDWALYDSEESLTYGRLSVYNREARDFISASPYVSTGYRSFIIERSGTWGDGEDEDDKYTHEFVWIDPLHLTLTNSPRSGAVTQIRTEAKTARDKRKSAGKPADALAWREARLIQRARGESASLSDVALRRFYALAHPLPASNPTPAPSRGVTPTLAPPRAESRNKPMNIKVNVEGLDLELPQFEAARVLDALKAKDKALATAQGESAAAAQKADLAHKAAQKAEADLLTAQGEAKTLRAEVEALKAESAKHKAEAEAARNEGSARLRLLRALGAEAKPADEALPIHDLRLRVVDALGFKESLAATKRADVAFVEAFAEGVLSSKGHTPAPTPANPQAAAAPTTPASPQAAANAENLALAGRTTPPAQASASFGWN